MELTKNKIKLKYNMRIYFNIYIKTFAGPFQNICQASYND